jgi:hypothetical protein
MIWDCLGQSHVDQYWFPEHDNSTGCYILWDLDTGYALVPDGSHPNYSGDGVVLWAEPNPPFSYEDEWCPQPVTP